MILLLDVSKTGKRLYKEGLDKLVSLKVNRKFLYSTNKDRKKYIYKITRTSKYIF